MEPSIAEGAVVILVCILALIALFLFVCNI